MASKQRGVRNRDSILVSTVGPMPPGFVRGFLPSWISATVLALSAGTVRDSANVVDISALAPLPLDLAANGAGGLDVGVLAPLLPYYGFVVEGGSSAPAAALASLSPVAPAMPPGYTALRRTGSFTTDAAGAARAFVARGSGSAREYIYTDAIFGRNLLVGGAAVVPSPVSAAAFVPATSDRARMHLRQSGPVLAAIYQTVGGPLIDALLGSSEEEVLQVLDAAQGFAYSNTGPGGSFAAWVLGYSEAV